MHADLDLLCISVYCTADDLLPERPSNGRRRLSDAEIVTLCVAQVLMGIPSDRRFLRAARRQLGHLFPYLPNAQYRQVGNAAALGAKWILISRQARLRAQQIAYQTHYLELTTYPKFSRQFALAMLFPEQNL